LGRIVARGRFAGERTVLVVDDLHWETKVDAVDAPPCPRSRSTLLGRCTGARGGLRAPAGRGRATPAPARYIRSRHALILGST
jgi:hypothetical protein